MLPSALCLLRAREPLRSCLTTALQPRRGYPPAHRSRTQPWALCESPLTLESARALLDEYDVDLADDVRVFITDRYIAEGACAGYGSFRSGQMVSWRSLLVRGALPVKIRPCVLHSREATLAVFAHELYEIEGLRQLLQAHRTLPAERIAPLIDPHRGALHIEAWSHADRLVTTLRARRDKP